MFQSAAADSILSQLEGQRVAPRVTEILWNEEDQLWEVFPVYGESREPYSGGCVFRIGEFVITRRLGAMIYNNKEREACVQWEKENHELLRRLRAARCAQH